MTTIPHYHSQPAVLDERVTIPDDAPLAQGHSVEMAADVQGALEDHKAQLAEEREPPKEPKKAAKKKDDD